MQYRVGTVTVSEGDSLVIGIGTAWITAGVSTGDLFWLRDGDGFPYHVAAVQAEDRIVLSGGYGGVDAANANYVISRSFTPNQGYPYPQVGDVDATLIVARAIAEIDADMAAAGGGTAGIRRLGDLLDVNTSGASNGEVLTYLNGTYILAPGGSGSVSLTVENSGSGGQILKPMIGSILTARSIVPGSARVSISQSTDTIAVDVPNVGETNVGSNIGTAESIGLYAGKNGTTLQYYGLRAGPNISLTQSGNDIVVGAISAGGGTGTTYNATNVGIGRDVYAGISGTTFQFKRLAAGSGVTADDNGSTITFSVGNFGFSNITDLVISNPQFGQSLRYNASGKWENYTPPAAGLASVSADRSPVLGGNLSVGGYDILNLRFDRDGLIDRPKARKYTLTLRASFGYLIDSIAMRTDIGSCSVSLRIGGTAIIGINNISVGTDMILASASGGNDVSIGEELDILIASPTADCSGLAFTISCRRA